jgi:predicted MPP superfamily phosphohydrolase
VLIVHLSDIHFRKSEVETTQDPNFHLRNELLRDVEGFCKQLGSPAIIIVSGDVAFGGHKDEYAFATKWLAELCKRCGAEMNALFVIPGNHDVVRATADKIMVQTLHKEIKSASDLTLDAVIRGFLSDKDGARLLYESLDNYNAFANQFLCDLLPPDRTRTFRDLLLNDGSTLRFWGLNTSFVSSTADKEGDLFVDPASMQITREGGVTNFVLAHHHLSWLRQKQSFEDHLNDVAPLQLFGHVHTNRIVMERDWVRLTASATHPDRHETAWEPGYNIIEVNVNQNDTERRLHIRAHVRIWQTAPGGFRAKEDTRKRSKGGEAKYVFEHWIDLEPWEGSDATFGPAATTGEANVDGPNTAAPSAEAMTALRDIGVRFYQLSFSKKSEIAGRLELLEEEDISQPDFERFRRVFLRAHDRKKLNELRQAIEEAEKG